MDPERNMPLSANTATVDFKKAIAMMQKAQSFLICTHVNPDPDALCSQIAVALVLKSLGKKVWVLSAEPIPKRFQFLPGSQMIRAVRKGEKVPYEVAVVVDCGDLARIGAVQEIIDPEQGLLNIDHHITNEMFGTVNLVATASSSASEVLFDLFKKMGVVVTQDLATLLYLGIMTDTGSFRYDNTTAHTHSVIAELMKHPIAVSKLYQILYETIPLNDIKYFTRLVGTFDFLLRGRVICLELRRKIIKKFSEEFDLRDKLFRYFRAVKGVEVIFILTEEGPQRTRVNLRSLRRVDVARLAYRFNGGGHSRASGCILETDFKLAKTKILAEIKKVI